MSFVLQYLGGRRERNYGWVKGWDKRRPLVYREVATGGEVYPDRDRWRMGGW